MMKYVIGLTGQSGSGKSVVAKIMGELGATILDCDEIAHKNMEISGVAYGEIVSFFGKGILNCDGTINRKALGRIVFNDKQMLKKLNEITHKHIYNYVCNRINISEGIIVIDAPLLFEAGLNKICQSVWSVVCDESIRAERVMKRDNITKDEAVARFKNQKDKDFFVENSDVVFDNSKNVEILKERVIYEFNKVLN
ncbi:MAG: dephospho-CoA kinase [Lachnospirales bacterium]